MKPDEYAANTIGQFKKLKDAGIGKAVEIDFTLLLDDRGKVSDGGSQQIHFALFPNYKSNTEKIDIEKMLGETL